MSATVHVITNSLGSGDYVVVYETNCGEVVFEGHSIKPSDLYHILQSTNGIAEYIVFHELTDEQMENWQDAMYQ
jgi:hypothetical protein